MGRKHKTLFDYSARWNNATFMFYYERLKELSISVFEWKGLPETVDERFLEMTLFEDGQALFFMDDVLGYLCLQTTISGGYTPYKIPIHRHAIAVNGYHADRDINDSVLIYNNLLHTNSDFGARYYAGRLYDLDRTVDVNARQQKTPGIVLGTEQQRLTLLNLYKEYDGNAPFIFADKNLDINSLTYISTGAPYVGDKLTTLKESIWADALTYLGIVNLDEKKERMISNETVLSSGQTIASRFSRLNARRYAAEQINKMFGLNISVDFREELKTVLVDPDPFDPDNSKEVTKDE